LVEQRFGLLQDRSAEAFGEPAVDRCEKVTGFGVLAFVAPETGEAGGGAEFKELGALFLADHDCSAEAHLIVTCHAEQIPTQPLHLSVVPAATCRLDQSFCLAELA
jgi:hypothetical protein